MNQEQIENWRKMMFRLVGPYALIIPDEQIIFIRDKVQERFTEQLEKENPLCSCDPTREGKTIHKDGRIECNKCHKARKQE